MPKKKKAKKIKKTKKVKSLNKKKLPLKPELKKK